MKISAIIVDDEPHARRYISDLLKHDNGVNVIGECKNGYEALAFIKNKQPDLVFLDIQMPGMSGIEVAAKLKNLNLLVVFITAYDQYALKAFETEAIDYLLKPFDQKRFFDALQRAKGLIEKNQQTQFTQKLLNLYEKFKSEQSSYIDEFIVKDKGLERTIHVNDIFMIESSSVYVILYENKEQTLYRTSLNLLERQLPPKFLRVHRSFIINTNYISKYRYLNNNTFEFILKNDRKLISSRSYKKAIQEVLSNN